MKVLEDMKELLEDELKKVVKKGDISPTELDNVYKAVKTVNYIDAIKMMEEESQGGGEYSQRRGRSRYSRNSYEGGSYEGGGSNAYEGGSNAGGSNAYEGSNAYRGSYEGSNAGGSNVGGGSNRGGQGGSNTYYREGGSNEYSEDGNSYRRGRDAMGRFTSREGGYSRHEEKERMIEKLEGMMNTVSSEKERQAIMQCIEKLEG